VMGLINEARGGAQANEGRTAAEYFAHGTIRYASVSRLGSGCEAGTIVTGTKRKAKDFFTNRKAQSWYEARLGFFTSWKRARQAV